MKIKCSCCHSVIEFDEKDYAPGDVVMVECLRCGEEIEVSIPVEEKLEKVRNLASVSVVRRKETRDGDIEARENEVSVSDNPSDSDANVSKEVANSNEYEIVSPSPIESAKKKSAKRQSSPKKNDEGNGQASKSKTPSTRPKKPRSPKPAAPPPISSHPHYEKPKTMSCGCLLFGMILFIVFGVGGYWLYSSFRQKDNTIESEVVEVVDVMDVTKETPVDVEEAKEEVLDSEWADTVVAMAAEEVPQGQSVEIARVYVPLATGLSAAEAYDVYPAYLTDQKLGDAWAATKLVQSAVSDDLVECFVKGSGDIEGYPLSIDAVRLKDGRIYGRYSNDYNGVTKLDINGVFDSEDNLIIKLGHKTSSSYDETSYWILKYAGKNDDGRLKYTGTWSRKNKPTNLTLTIQNHR